MPGEFEQSGIRFQYPDNWRLERQETDTGWTVMVDSPDTAFFLLSLDELGPSSEDMLQAALDALREDYPDLEYDECVDSLAGQPALGHNLRFTSLDLTNTCWTRSFYCAAGTVLVMCQLEDRELETHEPVLRAICASLTLTDE
ncbi:MAG: hypothetical protein L0Z62_07770 [Gemmataceae bacterium]|nr:hypothetical protein [Gemmataceae bacterium]